MNQNIFSTAEAFHNGFFYFIESLSTMTLDAAGKRDLMEGTNAAWELRDDVLSFGAGLNDSAGDFLDKSQKMAIEKFLKEVSALPQTSLSTDQNVMSHIKWMQIRVSAENLIALLACPIEKNQVFFEKYKAAK